MDQAAVLRAYDAQLRRSVVPPAPGWTVAMLDDPAPLTVVDAGGSAVGTVDRAAVMTLLGADS